MTTRQFQTIAYIDCVNLKKNSGEVNYRVLWNYLKDRFETRNNGLSVKIFIPLAVNEKRENDNFITYLKSYLLPTSFQEVENTVDCSSQSKRNRKT